MATVSPGSSWLNAMWPGPAARIITNGIPAYMRSHPPDSGIVSIRTVGSVHSRTWCEKYTQSSGARPMSVTGTYRPSTWQVERPNWIRAMSRIGGCSSHPESLTRSRTSTGAPQCGQLVVAPVALQPAEPAGVGHQS